MSMIMILIMIIVITMVMIMIIIMPFTASERLRCCRLMRPESFKSANLVQPLLTIQRMKGTWRVGENDDKKHFLCLPEVPQ